ncbi:MAG TPA: HD-GYP domain-containing protein [Firmicutes bacterium]|nr:HD-GYP domain-containing protein [Bacillota bacterium]
MGLKPYGQDRQAAEGFCRITRAGGQGGKELTKDSSAPLVLAIAAVMEVQDSEVHAHCLRVARYAVSTARRLRLDHEELEYIEEAALLHDVGKVGVPTAILNKPGPLTEEEYKRVKRHPVLGEGVVKKVKALAPLAPLVRSHHEWYNGRGYPDGIAQEAIPLGARIIAVADAFDAMTSDRPYRRAYTVEASARELEACAGTQFDPRVVEAFLSGVRYQLRDGSLMAAENTPPA